MSNTMLDGMEEIHDSLGLLDEINDAGSVQSKLDGIKNVTDQTLTDTADMQPKLGAPVDGTISQDIANIDTKVSNTAVDVTTIKDTVTDASYGNSALLNEINENETKIDSVKTDTSNIINTIGTPSNNTVSQDIADLRAVVDSINEGQGMFMIAIDRKLEVPNSGTKSYPFQIVHKDNGSPSDLDSNPTLTLTNAAGTDYSGLFYDSDGTTQTNTPSKDSDGIYKGFIILPSTQALEPLSMTATGAYSGNVRYQAVELEVQEYSSDSFLTSDRTTINDILTDTADMQPRLINVETDINNIQDDLTLIKNKDTNNTYDRTTDSLEALGEGVTELVANIGNANSTSFEATKTSGTISVGGNELVALGSSDGFSSIKGEIILLQVIRLTGDATKIKVNGFEDSGMNNYWYKRKRAKKLTASNDFSHDVQIDAIFSNKDATPAPNCYVYIEVTAGGSNDSTFQVNLRGIELN